MSLYLLRDLDNRRVWAWFVKRIKDGSVKERGKKNEMK